MLNIAFVVFILLTLAYLALSEISFFSLPFFTIKSFAVSQETKKRTVARLLESPSELLVTLIMLNVILNILLQNTISSFFKDNASWLLKVGLPLALVLIVSEIIPKSIALPNNRKIAVFVSSGINVIYRFAAPLRRFLTFITSYVSRIMFFFLKKERPITNDELLFVLNTSQTTKVINTNEAEIIKGYMKLNSSSIKEHMHPREEIIFFDINDPYQNLINIIYENKIAKIPVCDHELDSILGIAHINELFAQKSQLLSKEDLTKILRKPLFAPDSIRALTLFQKMRDLSEDIAIIVDEYGAIVGLVTFEDLIEKVIGEIFDENEQESFTFIAKNRIIASGKMEIDEFEKFFNVNLERDRPLSTVGGWLIDKMREIPQAGAHFETKDFVFQILTADPNKIKRIYIKKKKK